MAAIKPSESGSVRGTNVLATLRPILIMLSLTFAFLAFSAGYGRYRFGSVSSALAFVRGERLLVDEPNKSISGTSGGVVEVRYSVTNWTGHSVKLIGMASSCTCTAISDMPMTLAASETKAVTATITTSERGSDLSGSIRLFTDDARHPEIKLAYFMSATPSGARQAK